MPEDASILIIAGPKTDPMDSELEQIRNYLKRGGGLFGLLNPFLSPKLCSLLKNYGFITADDIVMDRYESSSSVVTILCRSSLLICNFPLPRISQWLRFSRRCDQVQASKEAGPNVSGSGFGDDQPSVVQEETKNNLNRIMPILMQKTGVKGPISVMAVSTYMPPETGSQVSKDTSQAGNKPEAADESSVDEKSDKKPKKARIVVIATASGPEEVLSDCREMVTCS